ncbi:hypothetical protein BCR21_13460 [Enterococcus ureasiticus]|uniref:Uncharacterized protein n=1 Tax=Enterococcus ureasiticus TaxID=903984 RepID=A0A1E5GCH7_9ENTE|nr:hypothetical protein BCR21_13460 [Enterococcus ureasiticus]
MWFNEGGSEWKKRITVRFDQYNYMPTIMKFAKQRYTCKNCLTHWTAQSYFVHPRHSFTNHMTAKISALLKEKGSLSFISKMTNVSNTTAIRNLKELGKTCQMPKMERYLFSISKKYFSKWSINY